MEFAPNNNQASKVLFTGRTQNLREIFQCVSSGICVGLYGERKCGKTLTLEILDEIINGDIEGYQDALVDETLRQALESFRVQLSDFSSIYVTLHGLRTEVELVNQIATESHNLNISSVPESTMRLGGLLDGLQQTMAENGSKLVILLDEMEILQEFEDGDPIAELFCDRKRFKDILFVHAGSYHWRDYVSSPGSLFTHLESQYLGSIDENDLKTFLLNAVPDDDRKNFVFEMSGGKPLYAQYIGRAVYDEEAKLSESDLLGHQSLCSQIEYNIFEETRLDDSAKKILATLAYHRNASQGWLSKSLKLGKGETRNTLRKLVNFGTVLEESGKYRIVGQFIERYGREVCDDPTRKDFELPAKTWPARVIPVLRWVGALMMIGLAVGIYNYTHPGSELANYNFSKGTLTIDAPG